MPLELDYLPTKPRQSWWRALYQYLAASDSDRVMAFLAVPVITAVCFYIFYCVNRPNPMEGIERWRIDSTTDVMSRQIELYRDQHGGKPPPLASFVVQMTCYSDAAGNVSTHPAPEFPFGPYVQSCPINPLNGNGAVGASPGTGIGWVYKVSGTNFTFEAVLPDCQHVLPPKP